MPQWDRDRWPEFKSRLAATFRTRPRDEWVQITAGTDACLSPVLTLAEARVHPHNRAREAFREVDGVVVPAPAPRFSVTPAGITAPERERALAAWGFTGAEILAAGGER
jgi:alpha-methylacyl-CoA racemase